MLKMFFPEDFSLLSLQRRSLLERLLWPVNIISFILLSIFFSLMTTNSNKAIETAVNSKVEGITEFLKASGQVYVYNYDFAALENFAKIITNDEDFAYVYFADDQGKALTDTSKVAEKSNIVRVEKNIVNQEKLVGKVILGYKKDRVVAAFWQTLKLGLICLFLTQILLTTTLFYISRGIVKPLQNGLGRLSETSEVISGTSQEVSKFSEALSSGVSQQAEAVRGTTSAMTEMSDKLAETSEFVKQSDTIMSEVTQKAHQGLDVMQRLVESMSSIREVNEQLKRMDTIIKEIENKTNVINEIVFKTQLLSFNAAIEAARAGEFGKGFAIVAEEVGNLAESSGTAAEEISMLLVHSEAQVSEILRSTNERVSIGHYITEQASMRFKEIADDINLISTKIERISGASREQVRGVTLTQSAMSELNTTTNVNNDIAQQTNVTSNVLTNQVRILNEVSSSIEASIFGSIKSQQKSAS